VDSDSKLIDLAFHALAVFSVVLDILALCIAIYSFFRLAGFLFQKWTGRSDTSLGRKALLQKNISHYWKLFFYSFAFFVLIFVLIGICDVSA
jgi:heme O synthase-like polyprenyltransferase